MSAGGVGAVLLDTCAAIWLANGSPMAKPALAAIIQAGMAGGIFVSPVSAWEVGLLARSATAHPVRFLPDARTWFTRLMSGPGIRAVPFTPDIAIDSSSLPGVTPGDPADRLIIATARHFDLPVVTRDAQIRAYARAGHVQVIAC